MEDDPVFDAGYGGYLNRDGVVQLDALVEDRRGDGPRDTVGAVAIDRQGRLASAASTSGTPYKPPGRVGDSAIFGAGGYAARGVAAVCSTGNGEQIYRTLLAKYAADRVASGQTAEAAASDAAGYFEARFPASMSGLIIVDHEGNVASSHTAPKMAHGWVDRTGQFRATVRARA